MEETLGSDTGLDVALEAARLNNGGDGREC
jgi:hypothetical protein